MCPLPIANVGGPEHGGAEIEAMREGVLKSEGIAPLLGLVMLVLAACETITPELVQQNLTLITPEGKGPFPVFIYYQGTGGDNDRARSWAFWLRTKGVASALVDNAGMRGRRENPRGSTYVEDAAIAWDILKDNPRIDTGRFALMGFSRGGQQALDAAPVFRDRPATPSFVFALYPGG